MLLDFLKLILEHKEASLVIILLLILVIFQHRYFIKELHTRDKTIETKDTAILNLSVKVIKLATLWEEKSDNNTEAVMEINKLLSTIRDGLIAKGILNP